MAVTYCSGPVFIYIGFPRYALPGRRDQDQEYYGHEDDPPLLSELELPRIFYQPVFLGTTEQGPEIHFRPYHRPIQTDDSGDSADDVAFLGEEALIFAQLNWYNEGVYAAIAARPNQGIRRGVSRERDIGTLLQRSGLTYPVWLRFPYSTKTIYGGGPPNPGSAAAQNLGLTPPGGGSPPNIVYQLDPMPAGYHFLRCFMEQDAAARLGTRARLLALAWRAIREPFDAGNARLLYDHDMTGLPLPR